MLRTAGGLAISMAWFLSLSAPTPAESKDTPYVEDFSFIQRTVQTSSAALKSSRIDWKGHCDRLRPAFVACTNDVDHVKNVMRLLAVLGDSHTGLWRSGVEREKLPSKWDGLYGGGLWFAWDAGRVMLRGVMPGHPQEKELPRGAALLEIGGEPAWLALEREKRRIIKWQGSSSDHSLFTSMGNRLLPFGGDQEITLKLMTPESTVRTVRVRRWGPGGKAFYPYTVQLPDGLKWGEGAVSTRLETPWCDHVGYLRITGSMDQKTKGAFHKAFDALEGMKAMILDCRGMGGGSDDIAWEMAGRFFAKPEPNGRGRRINPSGSWQFSGPVVMLQDELEVSSAETFTWAMSETERAVSVGRPTGGWAIIPRVFKCPSGLVDFRLGVSDRATPIRGVHTEGVGWPPDIEIPYGPLFCKRDDPDREVGMEVLRFLHAGVPRKVVVEAFSGLFAGHVVEFDKTLRKLSRKYKISEAKEDLADLVAADVKATLVLERALLESKGVVAPDALGASRRIEVLAPTAKSARLGSRATRLRKLIDRAKAEAAAQKALLEAPDESFTHTPMSRRLFLKRYGDTRVGRYARENLWHDQ